MNRRQALVSTGSMVVSASLGALACGGGTAVAQNTTPKTPGAKPAGAAGAPPAHVHDAASTAVLEAANGCLLKGDACIAHCIALLASGDTSMGGCAKTVHDMLGMMQALSSLAASNSRHLPAAAKVAIEICKDCETECRKHEGHHATCRECAEACARTVAACQKVVG